MSGREPPTQCFFTPQMLTPVLLAPCPGRNEEATETAAEEEEEEEEEQEEAAEAAERAQA